MPKLSYSKFLWNSVNAHGVHSPFVFSIVVKGLTTRSIYIPAIKTEKPAFTKKATNVLCRMMLYFKAEKLYILGDEASEVTENIRSCAEQLNSKVWFFSTMASIPGIVDMVYIPSSDKSAVDAMIDKVIPNMGNSSFIVLKDIHSSEAAEATWSSVKQNPHVSVTIDTYHLGIVFCRQGQAKEHFMVRTTSSKFIDFALGTRTLWGLISR